MVFRLFYLFIVILLYACIDISKQHPIDVLKYEPNLLFVMNQLKLSGVNYFCLESNQISSIKNRKKVEEIMNILDIDCVHISIKDSTVAYSSNHFFKVISYLYDFSNEGDELTEYDEPNSSSFLKKVGDHWYYQETGFD